MFLGHSCTVSEVSQDLDFSIYFQVFESVLKRNLHSHMAHSILKATPTKSTIEPKQTKLSEPKRVAQNFIINTKVVSQKKIVLVPLPKFSIIWSKLNWLWMSDIIEIKEAKFQMHTYYIEWSNFVHPWQCNEGKHELFQNLFLAQKCVLFCWL